MVSGRYLLLIHSDIHQALESSGLTIEWTEKIVAVGLMGRYLYFLELRTLIKNITLVLSASVNMASSKGAAMVQVTGRFLQSFLNVLNVVEPGLSKFRAKFMFEMIDTKMFLFCQKFKTGTADPSQLFGNKTFKK